VPVVYAYALPDDPDDVSFVPDDVDGAAQAVRHLFAAMDGRAAPGIHRLPCRLIIRESTV